MNLTPSLAEDLDLHLRRYKDPITYRPKVMQVLEMSAKGCTWEEIRNVVKMSKGNIGSARKWGRQRGLC